MGNWKYLNWAIVIIILVHMYWYFYVRYEAPSGIYIVATAAWLVITALGYYIFVYKIHQTHKSARKPIAENATPKFGTKEKPKVVFRKKDQHSK